MHRLLVFLLLIIIFSSCSKKEYPSPPPVVIPDKIYGTVYDFNLTPADITTPDKGYAIIMMDNTGYKVAFKATDQANSNAVLHFESDSILTNESREVANLGRDVVAYNPVADNQIEVRFNDGRKIVGQFNAITNFGGTFGEQVIAQWRTPNDPAKPNQKAKDDIRNLIQRFADKDGSGPDTAPLYLFVTVSKQ